MKKITCLLCFAMLSSLTKAQTPGISIFDTSGNNYIEYIPGNLPIIISAPHGGVKQSGQTIGGVFYPDNDSSLNDRSCGTNERDDHTDILVRRIQSEIFSQTGGYAHIVINNLHRSKLDPNREIGEATCGDTDAAFFWTTFHDFIDDASASVNEKWGKGLYIDLHGQSHTIPRIEIGYNITSGQLNSSNLNSTANVNNSTIKNLVSDNLNGLSHEDLIRGELSLGELFQETPGTFYNANVNPGCGITSGYRAIPSHSDYGNTSCDDTKPYNYDYFNGNYYNNRRHGSGNGTDNSGGNIGGGGTIDGIMTEVNRRVRDLGSPYDSRPNTLDPFAIDYAHVILEYLNIHYNDFSEFDYGSSSYDVTDSNPTPTLTHGVTDGIYLSTPSGLVIDQETGTIDVSASTIGNYTVTYSAGPTSASSAPNRYYSTSRSIEIADNTLSLVSEESLTVKLYPNPTTGIIHVTSNINISEVKVFSIIGQRVMSAAINSNQSTLDLTKLRPGSYVLTLYIDGQSLGSKLIVKH